MGLAWAAFGQAAPRDVAVLDAAQILYGLWREDASRPGASSARWQRAAAELLAGLAVGPGGEERTLRQILSLGGQDVLAAGRATSLAPGPPGSRTERQLRAHLEQRGFELEYNAVHKTGFELDVWDAKARVNLELDGPQHARVRRVEWDHFRDARLKLDGVRVVRVQARDARLFAKAEALLRAAGAGRAGPG